MRCKPPNYFIKKESARKKVREKDNTYEYLISSTGENLLDFGQKFLANLTIRIVGMYKLY